MIITSPIVKHWANVNSITPSETKWAKENRNTKSKNNNLNKVISNTYIF